MQNRRDMLKLTAGAFAGIAVSSSVTTASAQDAGCQVNGLRTPWADILGWKVGCQVYSFNKFTFLEAVKKNVEAGCRYLEAFPGQKLTSEGGSVGPQMNKAERNLFKTILADHGCVCLTFGVADASRATFDFCSEMNIEVINAEPPFDRLPEIDKLCEEYNMKVALQNHPKPSLYWNYETVLEVIKDLSPRIGACVDTGHYMRSGINPLDAIKALKGRIIGFHFKDLQKYGEGAHDVPWGTGEANASALLSEIAAQKFRGCFSAEYEHNWDNSVPEIKQSIAFFEATSKKLALAE